MTPAKLPHKHLLPLAAILALSLMLATSNLLIQPAMAYKNYKVTILDLSFKPQIFSIEYGDTVVWNNSDPLIYTIWLVFVENKSTYLLSDPIPPSQSWSHTFTEFAKFKLMYYSFERLWINGAIKIYKIFGDIDGDGDVDVNDFAIFSGAYGSTIGLPAYKEWADFNCNGKIDVDDFATFSAKYGKKVVP